MVSRTRQRPRRSTSTTATTPSSSTSWRAGADLAQPDVVGLTAVAELDAPSDGDVGPRPAPAGPAEERRSIELGDQVACRQCRGDEGDVGVARRQVLVGGGQAIEPRRVDRPGAHLRALEQVEQEGLVRRPATDDDRRLRQGAVQPAERLLAVAAVGDDLGDHRVVLGRDHVALGDAGVDADARAGGSCSVSIVPGAGAKARWGSSALSRASMA